MQLIQALNFFIIYITCVNAALFVKQEGQVGLEQEPKKHLFGKDGTLHEKIEKMKADAATKPPLFGKDGTIHHRVEEIKAELATKQPLFGEDGLIHDKVENIKAELATKKPLFGEDGVINKKVEDIKAELATKQPLFGEDGVIHEKIEDLKTKPLVNATINAKVQVLHSQVEIHGGIVIGGNKTGAHFSGAASIVGQNASIHADILNGHEGTGHAHSHFVGSGDNEPKVPIKEKLHEVEEKIKHVFDKNKNQDVSEQSGYQSGYDSPDIYRGQIDRPTEDIGTQYQDNSKYQDSRPQYDGNPQYQGNSQYHSSSQYQDNPQYQSSSQYQGGYPRENYSGATKKVVDPLPENTYQGSSRYATY